MAVKAGPPGVAQAGGPDFVTIGAGSIRKGIAGRDGVISRTDTGALRRGARPAIYINARYHPQQITEDLGIISGISRAAAIAQWNVEIAIRAEMNVPRIMISIRLGNGKQYVLAIGIGDIGIAGHAEAGNA